MFPFILRWLVMSRGTEQRKLAAIMFTDMVGYSALAQRDEALALALLEEHRELIRRILPKHQGTEIKTTGDGFLVEFASGLAAVQSAVEIQQALSGRNEIQPSERQVRIRIGIHLGDVVRREDDVVGDGVNIAARLEPLAEPGGICISRAVFEQVQGKLAESMISLGAVELKNLARPVEVFRVELHCSRGDEAQISSAQENQSLFLPVATPQKSLAVLPFLNMSPEQENEFLCDGITEDLIMALSRVKGLRVPASTVAYELYVKGRVYWNQRGVGLNKALHYFELALLEDPDYALAWSGLADAYAILGFYDFLPCREALAKALAAAEKAVALDDYSAEAHSALGMVVGFYDWDFTRAKMELERAVQLNPSYSPARCWYAAYLAEEGRGPEALEQGRLGVESDPLSVFANVHLGWTYSLLRRFDEALPSLHRCLELDPNSAVSHWQLGLAYWFTDQRETAVAEMERAVDWSGRNPMMLAFLGWALAQSGKTNRAQEIWRELAGRTTPAPTRPLFLALLHAALGENDLAFAALERALAERELWLPLPRAIAGLTPLESDPRWPVFVGKVKAARHASSSASSPLRK